MRFDKKYIKELLRESGNTDLATDENLAIAIALTKQVAKTDKNLGYMFEAIEGWGEEYAHDLIVKNCKKEG